MTADARRAAVLQVAVAEFARTGLHGTSTEKIAAGADISHPYLFRLFGTKKGLFLACLDRCHERLHETFTAAAEAAGDGDRLAAMGKAYVDLLGDREMLLLQLQGYAACDDPDVRATATIQFFRSMGGSLAVAALGTLLANHLASDLRAELGANASRIDTDRLLGGGSVPAGLSDGVRQALDSALHDVFVASIPLGVVALVLALALREVPLRTWSHESRAPDAEPAKERAAA